MATTRLTTWRLAVSVGLVTSALAAEGDVRARQMIHVTKTERVDFAPGGTIHIKGSHGDLNVEGWDRPEVEVTVTRSTTRLYNAKEAEEAKKRLDLIQVKLDHKNASELSIATEFPSRKLSRLNRGKSNLMLEYQIHVPRDSRLMVHHDLGMVMVTGVTGDVDARVGTGDILLMVPQAGGYSIDAESRFGTVESDFGGTASSHKLVGHQMAFAPAAAKHKLTLRVGAGDVHIQELPAVKGYALGK
jgi:hypothetical protein